MFNVQLFLFKAQAFVPFELGERRVIKMLAIIIRSFTTVSIGNWDGNLLRQCLSADLLQGFLRRLSINSPSLRSSHAWHKGWQQVMISTEGKYRTLTDSLSLQDGDATESTPQAVCPATPRPPLERTMSVFTLGFFSSVLIFSHFLSRWICDCKLLEAVLNRIRGTILGGIHVVRCQMQKMLEFLPIFSWGRLPAAPQRSQWIHSNIVAVWHFFHRLFSLILKLYVW